MSEEIKEKKYRYGYQAFWIVCFLLLFEALLETFSEPFAAVPGPARAVLLVLLGLFYFILRCVTSGMPISRSYGFDALWGGLMMLSGLVRIAGNLLFPAQIASDMRIINLVISLIYTLPFAVVAAAGLVRFLRQRK